MTRKSDRIEATLGRVEEAAGQIRDVARGVTAILSRLDGLDSRVADLAQAVAVVMAARKERGDIPDLSDVLAEVRAVRALVTPAQPGTAAGELPSGLTTQMAAIDKAMTALAATVASAVKAGQAPPPAGPAPKRGGGTGNRM